MLPDFGEIFDNMATYNAVLGYFFIGHDWGTLSDYLQVFVLKQFQQKLLWQHWHSFMEIKLEKFPYKANLSYTTVVTVKLLCSCQIIVK